MHVWWRREPLGWKSNGFTRWTLFYDSSCTIFNCMIHTKKKNTISVFNIIQFQFSTSAAPRSIKATISQYRQSWRTEMKTTMKMLSHVNYHRCFIMFPWRRPRRRHTKIPVVANVLWPLLLLLVVVSASGGAGGDDGVLEVFCEHRRNSHRVRVLFRHGYGTKARREMESRRRMWLSVVVCGWW